MKKLNTTLFVLFVSIFLFSCGANDDNSFQSNLEEAIDEYNDATEDFEDSMEEMDDNEIDVVDTEFIPILFYVFITYFVLRSIMIIPERQSWVIQRLGKFNRIARPGFKLRIPIIESVASKENLKIHDFDYFGNSHKDLPIWKYTRKSIHTNAPQKLIKTIKSLDFEEREISANFS